MCIRDRYSGGHILPAALRVFVEKVGPVFDTIVLDTAAGMGVPFHGRIVIKQIIHTHLQNLSLIHI